ncbi:uncharacterized protein [Dendropsophus ebraccatus]|uniref:uncharacterized protein n=1 Tax=Dendropsophus ebraccatus TaxID=150705 RepID=UPI0038320102
MAGQWDTPVQDTSRQETSSEMDSGYFAETPVSTQETPILRTQGQEPNPRTEIYWDKNLTSFESCKWENNAIKKTYLDILDDNHATEHHDISWISYNRNGSEEYEEKRKISDGFSTKDNAPTDLKEDRSQEITRKNYHSTMPCALENYVPTASSLDDSTTNVFKENFAPEKHRSNNNATKVSASGHDGDCKPSNELLAHHEVSNSFSPASQTDGDVSDSRMDGGTSIDACTTTTCCKLQGGANMDKNNTEERKIKISTAHGGDNNDNSCHVPNINKADIKGGKSKAFDWTSHNYNASRGLLQDGNVTEVTRPGDHTTIILSSGDSVTANSGENNPTLEEQSVNSSTTQVSESGHDCNVGYKPNVTRCKMQDRANMDKNNARDSKIKTFHGGDNNDYSCHGPNILETNVGEGKGDVFNSTSPIDNSSAGLLQDGDVTEVTRPKGHTTMMLKSNLTLKEKSSNISTTGVFVSGHNGDVGYRPSDETVAHHEVNNSFSRASKTGRDASDLKNDGGTSVDAYTTTTHCKLQDGANMDKNNAKDSEIKISTDYGEDNNCSFHTEKVPYRKTHTGERNEKVLNGASPNDNSSTSLLHDSNVTEVTRPEDRSALIMRSEDSAIVSCEEKNLTLGGHRSDNGATKVSESEHNVKNHRGGTSRPYNGGAGLWKVLCFAIGMMVLVNEAQASPVSSQWFQFKFSLKNKSLMNQCLVFKNMDNLRSGPVCTVNLKKVPSYHNCSDSQSWLIAENDTDIVMMIEVNSTQGINMEYGNGLNGENVQGIYGGRLSEGEVMAKIAEYPKLSNSSTSVMTEPPNSPPPRAQDDPYTVWIAIGIPAAIVLGLVALLLYCLCPGCKSKVATNRTSEPDTNRTSETDARSNPSAMPLLDRPPTNGSINGQVPTEEDQEEVV